MGQVVYLSEYRIRRKSQGRDLISDIPFEISRWYQVIQNLKLGGSERVIMLDSIYDEIDRLRSLFFQLIPQAVRNSNE